MGEHGRFEQIVSQFLLKTLHIILDSRVPLIHTQGHLNELVSNVQAKKSDKWFSLVLGDRPTSLENLQFWNRDLTGPMIIDVFLVQEISDSSLGLGKYKETLIERWVVDYKHVKAVFPQCGDFSASYKKTYKKSIILLRSVYVVMRLLPAYRVFRKLCSSTQACDLDINYKVLSFSSPLSREEEEKMKQYHFSSIEAPNGHLSISVAYHESLSNFNIGNYASFPPQIITDYVGSLFTDPFRAFPSLVKGVSSTNSQFRGVPTSNPNPFQRPHTWTSGGIYRPPPVDQRTALPPYESSSPPNDVYNHIYESFKVPSQQHMPSLDEYQLSPPFSPCHSPPTSFSGGKSKRVHMHAETAPVSIPHPMMSRSPRYYPSLSPNRRSLPPMSPKSMKLDPSSQDSPSGIRISRKSDTSRAADSSHKGLKDSREDSGRFSALLSSSGSQRIGFSRSSSRLSFQDDLDECDFSCPFIVDDVDSSEYLTSHNIEGRKGSSNMSQASLTDKKSQDSAVGALVLMLKHAPPLRPDSSSCYSSRSSCKTEVGGNDMAASCFFMTRKTSDAMEELRSYKAMKDLLLSKSITKIFAKEEN